MPAANPAPTSHDQLVATKRNLEIARDRLLLLDPSSLSEDERQRQADEFDRLDLAIARARNALLDSISADFAAALPALQKGADRLAKDLANARKAVDVINAVGAALGIVEQVITLARPV